MTSMSPSSALGRGGRLPRSVQSHLAEARGKVQAVRAALLDGEIDADALEMAHAQVHALSVSSVGTSLPGVSESARPLETFLSHLMLRDEPPNAEQHAQLAVMVRALGRAVGNVAKGVLPVPCLAAPPGGVSGEAESNAAAATPASRVLVMVEHEAGGGQDSQVLSEELERFGYRPKVLHGLAELPSALRDCQPAAVIVDMGLPEGELAGGQAVDIVHEVLGESAPVLIASMRDDLEARLTAVRSGAAAFLTRPVDVGLLVDRLDLLTRPEAVDPFRVAVIDDDPALSECYGTALSQAGFHVRTLNDPLKTDDLIRDFRPELILMDVEMPGCSGLELAAALRLVDRLTSVPIILLSEETSVLSQQRALAKGGDDFLIKPFDLDVLVTTVAGRVARARAMSAMMWRDSLTGLLNHSRIAEALEIELARARRSGEPLSVAMLDLDRFKTVNDTYGHTTGDRVIQSLARLLRERLRKTDRVGRYGGEEFAVILPNTSLETAATLMDKLRESYADLPQRDEQGRPFTVTFSCGIAAYPAFDDPGVLFVEADRALYAAKNEGRNRVVTASQESEK